MWVWGWQTIRWGGFSFRFFGAECSWFFPPFQILRILSGKIVIGHAIHNDFKALKYFHPKSLTRDTSKIPLLNRKAGFPETKSASLKRLTKQLLQRDIQVSLGSAQQPPESSSSPFNAPKMWVHLQRSPEGGL